jgi:predicted RND superfamily exporter protein
MSVPFVFASALMLCVMVALEIPLDGATAAITALAINASVDFSIYMADAYQEGQATHGTHAGAVRHALSSKGRIVLADMLLNVVCFFPLTFSRFVPIHELGWIMMVMLLACGFGTVVLMPALLAVAMPRPLADEPPTDLRNAALDGLEVTP